MKVLVADDSPLQRKILDQRLVAWGYDVRLASDGNEALAILENESDVRLAIVDGAMPGLTGPELCKTVRTGNRPYVYIILLSANDRDDDIKHGFEYGADDYLCKPFKDFELRARLNVGMRILDAQKELLESRERLACQAADLEFQAAHDALTRLWNRGGILELLKTEFSRAQRTAQPFSVCLADLDHFKRINDTYGHLAGDEVLHAAGVRMSDALRRYDHLGRYGGEEFLVVLPGCTAETAMTIAERLRRSVADQAIVAIPEAIQTTMSVVSCPEPIHMTISIGVSEWQAGMEISDLLRQADVALYRAKGLGRNRVELQAAEESSAR
jgi:diguanylate cyclase (GGDEF)-like protein